ncbi:MAG: hypothetical protein AB6733_20350 [Clostridiaceae bacterium]
MKDKAIISVILSLVAIIGGLVINFPQFLMGNSANVKNLIATLVYLIIWVLALIIGARSKCRGIMKCFFVFWISTLIFSVMTIYVNITEVYVGWAIPFVILLLSQWYGIGFFINGFVTIAIIIAVISLVMTLTVMGVIKNKFS